MSRRKMITNTLLAPVSSTHLLISKDGYSFDRNSNKWALNKDAAISFQSEVLALDSVTLEGFRLTLARYVHTTLETCISSFSD
jgi:hypothetical protein